MQIARFYQTTIAYILAVDGRTDSSMRFLLLTSNITLHALTKSAVSKISSTDRSRLTITSVDVRPLAIATFIALLLALRDATIDDVVDLRAVSA